LNTKLEMRTKNKIALLCPVRARPDYLYAYCESIDQTATQSDRLALMFYVDSDDPAAKQYQMMEAELRAKYSSRFEINFMYGDPIGALRTNNIMAAQSDADIFMISNDDLNFVTPGWDTRIDQAATDFPDGIYNIWFNDGYFGDKLSCFPIVSRVWCEALGYILPPLFEHFVGDHWIHHLGRFLKRNVYLEDVLVSHRHKEAEKSGLQFAWQEEGFVKRRMDRDNEVFRKSERYLRLDTQILQQIIDAGK
jgi:hypothetical protein